MQNRKQREMECVTEKRDKDRMGKTRQGEGRGGEGRGGEGRGLQGCFAHLNKRAASPKGTERCPVMSAMAVISMWSSTYLSFFHVLKYRLSLKAEGSKKVTMR